MPPQKTIDVQLSEAQAREVQRYADLHGLTLEQACTALAHQAIQARFVRPRAPARVVPLVRGSSR